MEWPTNLQQNPLIKSYKIPQNSLDLVSVNTIPTQQTASSYINPTFEDYTQAASNQISTKPSTNGALGAYRAASQVLNAVSTGIEMGQILSSSRAQERALKAQAKSNLQQMDLNYAAYRTQNEYLAEENLSRVNQVLEQGRLMEGQQLAAMGASGFDVSAGDQRIIADTKMKTTRDIDALNRSTYLQSFEMWRATMLENTRLEAEAKLLKTQAKAVKKAGKIGAISRAVSGALGAFNLAYGGISGKNIGVGGK